MEVAVLGKCRTDTDFATPRLVRRTPSRHRARKRRKTLIHSSNHGEYASLGLSTTTSPNFAVNLGWRALDALVANQMSFGLLTSLPG